MAYVIRDLNRGVWSPQKSPRHVLKREPSNTIHPKQAPPHEEENKAPAEPYIVGLGIPA